MIWSSKAYKMDYVNWKYSISSLVEESDGASFCRALHLCMLSKKNVPQMNQLVLSLFILSKMTHNSPDRFCLNRSDSIQSSCTRNSCYISERQLEKNGTEDVFVCAQKLKRYYWMQNMWVRNCRWRCNSLLPTSFNNFNTKNGEAKICCYYVIITFGEEHILTRLGFGTWPRTCWSWLGTWLKNYQSWLGT